MADTGPVVVADTSTLMNLASPRVDTAVDVPDRDDPLKHLLVSYDVHVPDTVLGELSPQLIGILAAAGLLDARFAAELMGYVGDHRDLSRGYIDLLKDHYLD